MNLNIKSNQFSNIHEIWIVGSHSVEIATKNDNYYKIIARENVRSGATPNFYASYEILKEVNINNDDLEIWVRDRDLPWQDGDTIESCITRALSWIDERK